MIKENRTDELIERLQHPKPTYSAPSEQESTAFQETPE